MKKYLFILLLLLAQSSEAVLIRTYTIGIGGDHATLAACESTHEQNFIVNDSFLTYSIIDTVSTGAEASVTIDGSITSTTQGFIIITTGNGRHEGFWDTNHYYISSNLVQFTLLDSHIVVDGIQVLATGSSNFRYGITIGGGANAFIMRNNITNRTNTGTSQHGFAQGINVTTKSYYYNNICMNNDVGMGAGGGDGLVYVYNNTLVDCGVGVDAGYNDLIVRNNLFYNNTDDIGLIETVNGDSLSYNNATNQSSITYHQCGSCGANDVYNITDPFVDYANDDFRLASGSDVEDDGDGSDAKAIFTDDIVGTTRPATDLDWDIGAFEFVAAAGGTTTKVEGKTDIDGKVDIK